MILNVLGIRAPVRMKCEKNKNVHGFHSKAHLEIFSLKRLEFGFTGLEILQNDDTQFCYIASKFAFSRRGLSAK